MFERPSDDFIQHVQGDMEQIEAAYLEIAELMPEVMVLTAEQDGRLLPKEALFDKLKQQLRDIYNCIFDPLIKMLIHHNNIYHELL